MNKDIITEAEEKAKQRAAELAYKLSERATDIKVQRTMYQLCYECIMHGTRIMQEELNKLIK